MKMFRFFGVPSSEPLIQMEKMKKELQETAKKNDKALAAFDAIVQRLLEGESILHQYANQEGCTLDGKLAQSHFSKWEGK
jgi:hypothetical protein